MQSIVDPGQFELQIFGCLGVDEEVLLPSRAGAIDAASIDVVVVLCWLDTASYGLKCAVLGYLEKAGDW